MEEYFRCGYRLNGGTDYPGVFRKRLLKFKPGKHGTWNPLGGAGKAYGQRHSQDFNPLHKSSITANRLLYWPVDC